MFRMPFDRITDIHLGNEVDGYQLADLSEDSSKLYSVAATSYVAKFAWTVEKLSQGVISIVPRDKDGNPVPTVEGAIIDGSTAEEGIQEVKEWEALLDYVQALPDINQDGLPDIEAAPGLSENRINVDGSFSPTKLLKNASNIMWTTTIFSLLIILVALIYFIRLTFKFFEAIR